MIETALGGDRPRPAAVAAWNLRLVAWLVLSIATALRHRLKPALELSLQRSLDGLQQSFEFSCEAVIHATPGALFP